MGLEQQRAHGRRQRQRDDQRNHGGAGDGEGELAIELAGNAGDEGRGHEHRAQHERDRDQRAPDLVHALHRGVMGRQPGGDIALDVLDHHDGIVDHDADREHQAEQRQVVERESECSHEEEGADQRDRDRHDGNDRGPPRLQEQDDDQHHQDSGLPDRLDDGIDRLLDELGRIVDDGVFDARRKTHRHRVHGVDDALGRSQRVRFRQLVDRERHRGVAVEIGIRGVVLGGEFDPRHVPEPHQRARGPLHHDLGEFIGFGEPAERLHRDLEGARGIHRLLVEHPGRDLDVLALQRRHHVERGHVEGLQPVGVEPDAHREIAAAEHRDRADAFDAGHRILDLERRVVGNEQRVARFVRRVDVHDHHQVGRRLGDGDTDIADVRRQGAAGRWRRDSAPGPGRCRDWCRVRTRPRW